MKAEYFTTGDGCRIAYDYRANGKPPLLLSPSLGTSMALFDDQLDAFGTHFSLLRYDPRGHGETDVPQGAYSLDRLGRDAIELLDHLGIGRAAFCGVSLGGMVGQWMGIRAPERLTHVVLAHTAAYMGPPAEWDKRIETVRRGGMAAVGTLVVERWFSDDFRAQYPSKTNAFKKLLVGTDVRGYAGSAAAIRDMDLRRIISLIEAPVLIIDGTFDTATPTTCAEELAAEIRSATMVRLLTAHLGNVERSSEFNRNMLSFLCQNG
ncbi:3-oxoadipate enol-lactonase [Parasphingopyxis algicola]|uniref:3-oxoadipate enol-lactonase n=1 Tax=Parasphingopyxis algicola TaxID=2026624 RepID=UPI0015A2BE29|nr:3-oxoadipate enol-lactonase [Parasphingopyxis algicola]QLC25052.1 3-oxoadipate enol-lactonase [Parasphingopyxis algicola]